MTKEQLEKYQKWTSYIIKTVLTLCFGAIIALGTHYVEAQSIHKNQSKEIEVLKTDVKKVIVIPNSIKLNEYKINQCNKAVDELKKDFKDFKISQDKKMSQIIVLLLQIKADK